MRHCKVSISRMWLKIVKCLILPGLLLTGLTHAEAYALSYYGVGKLDVTVWVDGRTTERVERSTGLIPVTSLRDEERLLGPGLNYAEAKYYGSLATGTVGAYVTAVNGFYFDTWLEAGAETLVTIADTLYFNIPAGYYPDGVSVELGGHVEGSRSDSYYGQSRLSFGARIGDQSYRVRIDYGATGPHLDIINEDFVLTELLVSPGTTLSEDSTVVRSVSLTLGGPMSLVASTQGNAGSEETFATVDFFNTGSINYINVPPGVTWTSASGVFLVPEPISSVLFVAGGVLLAGRVYLGRKKRA